MLDFVLRWSSFDDGDEYILPEFGLTPAAFYRRVLSLITKESGGTNVATRASLRTFCLSKLSPSPPPIRATTINAPLPSSVRRSSSSTKNCL